MKIVTMSQSNYIPWKGYIDLIAIADEFIFYDSAQYTRKDWRNRNLIKIAPDKTSWLTIPVAVQNRFETPISQVKTAHQLWRKQHWNALVSAYRRAPYFDEVAGWLHPLYSDYADELLSHVNHRFLTAILNYLGIETKISQDTDYALIDGQTERIVHICAQANADVYIVGPSARNYIQEDLFTKAGIELRYMDYADYPAYPQFWGAFEHKVSVLDLLFHTGKEARNYLKYMK